VESLQRHCQIPFFPLLVGQGVPDFGMPNGILQAGHFLDFIPECETVIFTDADLLMHRAVGEDELEFIASLDEGKMSACYNKHGEELWAEEVAMLGQVHSLDGYDNVRVFNTGFLIARISTYRMMFARFQQLWPAFNNAFGHYAKIQLCICAAARDLGIEWVPTPGHLCSHGHFGSAPGVNPHVVPPTFNDRTICFAHRVGN